MESRKKEGYPESKPEDKQYENQDEFDNRSKNEKVISNQESSVKTSTGASDKSIRNQDADTSEDI